MKKQILFSLCIVLISGIANGQIITTIAGNGVFASGGDGGPATAAQFSAPVDVATDGAGNVYVVDANGNKVRKVDASGIVTTVAGAGTPAFSGDGGAATAAELNGPYAVAIDGAGNLYIADAGSRIRKVNSAGIISTIAGNGTAGFGGDGGPATAAQLNSVSGVAVDGTGNIYIADQVNFRIRKVDVSGMMTTIAGNGTAGYSGDGAAATAAELSYPKRVAVDGAGNVYIADMNNDCIRRVNTSGIITTFAGNHTPGPAGDGGAATAAQLHKPVGVATDGSGNVYIADANNYRIRKVNTTGTISTIAGIGTSAYSGDGGPATAAQLLNPWSVAVDGMDNVFIADLGCARIRKINVSTTSTPFQNMGADAIRVYPNPATRSCTIEIPELLGDVIISVMTVSGQICKIQKATGGTQKIVLDLGMIPPGLYAIQAQSGGKIYNAKVSIE